MTPAHHVVHVKTVMTTEAMNPHLLKQLEAAGGCVLPPRSPINADVVKIDSL